MKPKVCILKADGTNCEHETAAAFSKSGADAEIVHLNTLLTGKDPVTDRTGVSLRDYGILAIAGGFSYGDYISSGVVLAQYLTHELRDQVQEFIAAGKPVIGICNGFQVLVKSGILPFNGAQAATLTYNDSGRYEDRWVHLASPSNNCIWTRDIRLMDLPVAHGEGKFFAPDAVLDELVANHQVVFQYVSALGAPTMEFPFNPNGALRSIAGICDRTGLVFGLMPHPERYNNPKNHPDWARRERRRTASMEHAGAHYAALLAQNAPPETTGMGIIENGVRYVQGMLCRR